ncbi:MAG: MATE family efflux transporter [Eubacteriales bacterium]|nr:MATE family efflux transporter [Eubacteriales bacterium]
MFSRQDLVRLIIPLVIEQTLTVLIGMADTVMVSSVSESAVSAISLVDSINILLIQLFSAMATGGAVVAAQYLGRRESHNACKAAKQLMYVSLFIALGISAIGIALCEPILRLCFGGLSDATMSYCKTYFYLSCLSYPALALYNGGAALLRAMGNSKASMYTSLLMNLTNIVGNALFIYGMHIEVMGAGIATLISRFLGAAIMVRMMLNRYAPIHIERALNPEMDFPMIKRIFRQGIPNGIENSIFQVGKLMVAGMVAMFSETIIAANAVSDKIATFTNLPGIAINLAMVAVVGQCIGAGDKEQAKYYTKLLVGLTWVLMILSNTFLYFMGGTLCTLFNLSPEGIEASVKVLRLFAIMGALFWTLSFSLPSSLRAAGDSRFTMIVSVSVMWTVRIGFSYLFVYWFHMGLMGIWLAMCLDWVFRAAIFVWRYLSGKWLNQRVI